MAELEMLPAWAGRLAEPTHPPQPPAPARHNGDGPTSTNGHGPSILAGQPPLPSGEHRLEPVEDDDDASRVSAANTTSELPVVSIPFEDETIPEPPAPAPAVDPSADTIEVRPDDGQDQGFFLEDLDDGEVQPTDEGDGRAGAAPLDEIVYEADEIELLEDTDPIGIVPHDDLPAMAPVTAADTVQAGNGDRPARRRRPLLRALGLLALAVLVVAAGVAAGYLFVSLTGG